jgi:hypothetical protein
MWLVAGFFDESTDQDSGGVSYTVAGFIGNQLVTAILELRWRDILNKYKLDYFKASELNAGMGQFQKLRDDPTNTKWRPFSEREKQIFQAIKTDFTDVIIGCGDGLYGIGAVVILPDLERLRAEYGHAKALPVPYFICANMVMVEAGTEMISQNAGCPPSKLCWLRPIFDEHEEYSGRAKQSWDLFTDKNPQSGKYLLPPHYESELTYLTLQAADNLAFEVRKLAFAQEKNLPTRIPMKRLIQGRNIIKIYKFDYDALKMVADAQLGIYSEDVRQRLVAAGVELPMAKMREMIGEPNGGEEPRVQEVRHNNAEADGRTAQRAKSQARRGSALKGKKAKG